MTMSLREFMGRCQFYTRGGRLYGSCTMRLRNGKTYTIQTRPEHGIPLSMLTARIAARDNDGQVSGLFGDAWKKAKGAATKVAKTAVSKDLLDKAAQIARSDLGAAALSVVPGGTAAATAIKLGSQAANLLGKASAGDPAAKAQIAQVAMKAASGSPVAKEAKAILQAVHAKGKAKGVFPPGKSDKKTVVKPGLPSTQKRALVRSSISSAPEVPTLQRPTTALAFHSSGSTRLWGGLPGLVRTLRGSSSIGDDSFAVGHWEQWQYD